MSNENKSGNEKTDVALDELLNSALEDFDKVYEPPTDDAASSSVLSSAKDVKETKESTEQGADQKWSQEFIKQTAESFEKNLQNLLQNGCEGDLENSFQKMAQTVATAISSNPSGNETGDGEDFQAAIAKALKDISATSENLKNAGEISEADLATMFGQVSLDESSGDILPLMQGMMQSLLSKEILYPSLKELVDKYPGWLDEKKNSLPSEDYERYSKQLNIMQKVCSELEKEEESVTEDVKKRQFEKILSLMQEMQNCGQPPEDLVGDQTGLFQMDGEGNPTLPPGLDAQNCSIM